MTPLLTPLRSLALLAPTALLALATPTAATAATAVAPQVGTLPATAAYTSGDDTARAEITYTCTDAPGQAHYLVLRLTQQDRPAYVAGYRGDTGGVLRATCTGEPVTRTIALARTSYEDPALPGLQRGSGTLAVTVSPRSAPEDGGWNTPTGDDVTETGTLQVCLTR